MSFWVLLAFLLRCNLPRSWANKYIIWTLFLVVANWSVYGPPQLAQVLNMDLQRFPEVHAAIANVLGPDTGARAMAVAACLYAAFSMDGLVHQDRTLRSLYTQLRPGHKIKSTN
eukprot:TRINITY_DN10219_c0_g1_i2.p3 TRINITY_DN10219_c0_g1~~TRINITY_DN10219_c0_g1_i2.p3  ORF type:complete len:114 (-),score=21.74 TRINITY_DN10219_c0_g1_i2:246-587(-)